MKTLFQSICECLVYWGPSNAEQISQKLKERGEIYTPEQISNKMFNEYKNHLRLKNFRIRPATGWNNESITPPNKVVYCFVGSILPGQFDSHGNDCPDCK